MNKKYMKYILCAVTSVVMCIAACVYFNMTRTEAKNLKIGFIFPGDEITPYTENFMDAIDSLKKEYGSSIECITKYNVSDDQVGEFIDELINENCNYIIAASRGYEKKTKEAAASYADIDFCVPLGDNADEGKVLSNYHTCSATIYQGRYVCGVAAGIKLKEMIDSRIITPEQAKIGYTATFADDQTIAGYTAFYLGVRSVVPEVTMSVKYTYEWSNYYREKKTTEELINQGCVIIAQHSDTSGPAAACEGSMRDIPVYHVGYNQSMTDIAPRSSLISCSIDYSDYFVKSAKALMNGKKIESCMDGTVNGQDVVAGLKEGWVRILDVNHALMPDNIDSVIEDTVQKIKKGTVKELSEPLTDVNKYGNAIKVMD